MCVCFGGGWVWLEWVWQGFGKGWGKMEGGISYPLPQLQATEAWEGGCLLSLLCVLQMCQNRGGWEGRVPGRAAPGWLSQSNTVPLLGNSKTGERVGWGPGVPHVQLCIFRGVLCLVPTVGIYVCVNLPFPMPCMTCDAADTTTLCAGVLGGTEGHVPCPVAPSTL